MFLIPSFVSNTELASLYRASDVFVLPTRGEGWGRPASEAMAMGLPAIITAWSGPSEFVTKANGYPLDYRLTPADVNDFTVEGALQQRRLLESAATRPAVSAPSAASLHMDAHWVLPLAADPARCILPPFLYPLHPSSQVILPAVPVCCTPLGADPAEQLVSRGAAAKR